MDDVEKAWAAADERAAIMAWLRDKAVHQFCDPLRPTISNGDDEFEFCASAIERGEHMEGRT